MEKTDTSILVCEIKVVGEEYMPKVSIIVPVYNAEKYLGECLSSLLAQILIDIEIICVNDGSTDRSGQILDEYATKDNRIKVIHKTNGGRVLARKIGMQNATGEMITFVDSDDWLEPNAIQCMYEEMCIYEADVLIAGYYENILERDYVKKNALESGVYRGEELEKNIYSQMLCKEDFFCLGISPFLWNKLFKREVIEKYILDVDERVVVGEDVMSVFPAILSADCVVIVDNAYYHYRIHNNSTMHIYTNGQSEYQNIQMQYEYLKRIFEKHYMKDSLFNQLHKYALHHKMVRCLAYFNETACKGANYPFQEMEQGSNLVIYGAGAFGISAHQFFSESNQYNVVGWCDKDYVKYQKLGYNVEDLQAVLKRSFDYVVIAIMSEKTVMDIKNSLSEMKLDNGKMRWLDSRLVNGDER